MLHRVLDVFVEGFASVMEEVVAGAREKSRLVTAMWAYFVSVCETHSGHKYEAQFTTVRSLIAPAGTDAPRVSPNCSRFHDQNRDEHLLPLCFDLSSTSRLETDIALDFFSYDIPSSFSWLQRNNTNARLEFGDFES